MQFHDVVYGRRSVRAFTEEPVDSATLTSLVDAASQAPSAMNAQPWSFAIIRNASLLDRISAQAKSHLLKNAAPGLHAGRFRDQISDPAFHIFYHASALVVISAIDAGPWATIDCALAAQNLMLAAESLGLGSCWIGFAQDWLQSADGRNMLGLSQAHLPVAPIVIGHPRHRPPVVPRTAPRVRWID